MSRTLLIAALAWLLSASACAGESDVTPACVDAACPEGERCGVGGCEPDAPTFEDGELGRYTATAARPDGGLVVATYDAAGGDLVVRVEYADGRRESSVVDGRGPDGASTGDAGRHCDVAVDGEGRVHLVWFHADRGQLRYGRSNPDGSWTIEEVDGGDGVVRGTHASLALGDAWVHVAYRDETHKGLRYARRSEDGRWETVRIDGCAGEADCPSGDEDVGAHASIAVIADRARIAFYDARRGDLKMASHGEDGAWETTTLDGGAVAESLDTGDVGRFASLSLGPNRVPGVAYHDATRGALRLVVAGSEPVVVDDGVFADGVTGAQGSSVVGTHVALNFDRAGRAVVLYLDGGIPAMKLAVVSGGVVRRAEVIEGLAPGVYPSFIIVDDARIEGAYGAWDQDGPRGVLRTRLERVSLPLGEL